MSIREVSNDALKCRDTTCYWEHVRSEDTKHPKYWGTYRYDLCVRCGNVKRRIENSDGSIAKSPVKYLHSRQYKRALKFTRNAARKELNRRDKLGLVPVVKIPRADLRIVS